MTQAEQILKLLDGLEEPVRFREYVLDSTLNLSGVVTALRRAVEALAFYENPPRKDEDGDPLPVPDFYECMDFGDTAREALTAIYSDLSGSLSEIPTISKAPQSSGEVG